MIWLYLHLMTNHFPIILTIVGTVACAVGAAKKWDRTWDYGVASLTIGALAAIPTWITGNQAHYVAEDLLGFPEGTVEPHELLAEATMWIMLPLAGLSAFSWWRRREEPRRGPSPAWVRPSVLAAGLAGCVMLGTTALLGGRMEHGKTQAPLTPADSAARLQQSWTPVTPPTAEPNPRR